jgi:hyperosmotically inducible periplasmic protein
MKTTLRTLALLTVTCALTAPLSRAADDRDLPTPREPSNGTRESTGEYIDDASITAKVKGNLLRDGTVKATSIHVTTYKGVVELSGFVDSKDQKSRADEIAEHVDGVRKVKNNIVVKD